MRGVHSKALFCHCLLNHSLLPNAYPSGSVSYACTLPRRQVEVSSLNCQLWEQGSESCVSGLFRFETHHSIPFIWKSFRTDLMISKGRKGILCLSWTQILEPHFDLVAVWPWHTVASSFLLKMHFLNSFSPMAAKDLPQVMCRWSPGSWCWVGSTYTEIHCLAFTWFSEDHHGSLPGKTLFSLMNTQYIRGTQERGLCCFQMFPEM